MNPILLAQIAEKVLGIIERFLDPQQFDIVRLKRLKKASNWAEKEFSNTDKIIEWVEKTFTIDPGDAKKFKEFKRYHVKCIKQHQRYD